MDKQQRRVLIYRLGSLGDTVIALPAFHKIKESFPNADITLLTNRPVINKAAPLEAVLGSDYFFNRVMDYPLGTRNPKVLFLLIKQIRALKIDTVVNLTAARSKKSTFRDQLFFRAAGVKKLIGFLTGTEDMNVCIDPETGQYEWEAKRLARRVESLGEVELENDDNWDLHLTAAELAEADSALSSLPSDKPIIVVCAGTKMQSKDWEDANWINLTRRLKAEMPDWSLVLIGAPVEAERAENCLAAWTSNGVNLCGKVSPRVSAAVIKKAKVFVGHDSGPMHLAAGVGTPSIAIFAAINLPRQWFPRGNNNKIIYHKVDCAGCGLEVCIVQKKKCILSINVDEVVDAVMEVVNNN